MQNARAGRADLSFLLITAIVLWCSRSHRRRSCVSSLLSTLHTSNFSLTRVIDNDHMLMCMNDKFSLTSFTLTSLICWCERINKFSLTSFHCSQQYNSTAGDKKKPRGAITVSHHENKTAVRPTFLNFLDKFSLSTRTDEQVLQCVNVFLDKCTCSKASMIAFEQVHLPRKELANSSLHTSK